jgi:membrane peptidoglycan carboxypeptidase
MIQQAQNMGITTWDDPSRFGLSLTLGGGEVKMIDMATVYGVFANNGKRNTVTPFTKITNAKGETLYEHQPENEQVLPESISFLISDILADNNARMIEFGPNSVLTIANHRVSVKTGTTDNKRDNWTIGYTKEYVVTTWVGNNDNAPMNPALTSGITGAAPIWNRMMTYLLKDKKDDPVTVPAGITAVPICVSNGIRTEYFLQGTQPAFACKTPITVTAQNNDKKP